MHNSVACKLCIFATIFCCFHLLPLILYINLYINILSRFYLHDSICLIVSHCGFAADDLGWDTVKRFFLLGNPCLSAAMILSGM